MVQIDSLDPKLHDSLKPYLEKSNTIARVIEKCDAKTGQKIIKSVSDNGIVIQSLMSVSSEKIAQILAEAIRDGNAKVANALIDKAGASLQDAAKALQEETGGRDKLDAFMIEIAKQPGLSGRVDDCIKAGANIEATSSSGKTALMYAAQNGHAKTVTALVAAGANKEANVQGWTPLMLAAYYGHKEVVEALVKAGADMNAKNVNGYTAQECAKDPKVIAVLNAAIAQKEALRAEIRVALVGGSAASPAAQSAASAAIRVSHGVSNGHAHN